MDECTLIKKMAEAGLTIKEGDSCRRIESARRAVVMCIKPRTQSDRTCLLNIIKWIEGLNLDENELYVLLRRIIDAGIEASGPMIKNPNAVFVTIMKNEFGYVPGL